MGALKIKSAKSPVQAAKPIPHWLGLKIIQPMTINSKKLGFNSNRKPETGTN
jgi:hypothetical protein